MTVSMDEQIKALVKEAVREEVRALLTDQLDNIVVGEMAKMKLFKPGTSDLATMITNKANTACSRALGQENLRELMVEEGRKIAIERAKKIADARFTKEFVDDLRMKANAAFRRVINEELG